MVRHRRRDPGRADDLRVAAASSGRLCGRLQLTAGQELDAIIKATEAASNTIMECAEAVLAADARDPAFKAMVDEKMLIMFEACSFQDITGQRVAKVIETLEHIEARVARFNDALRVRDAGGFVSEAERASAERKERLLLSGPQLDGRDRQSEVDRLLAK